MVAHTKNIVSFDASTSRQKMFMDWPKDPLCSVDRAAQHLYVIGPHSSAATAAFDFLIDLAISNKDLDLLSLGREASFKS